MTPFLYTARAVFDQRSEGPPKFWSGYVAWSGLTHVTEIVSLDGLLNEVLFEPDYKSADDWQYIHSIKYSHSTYGVLTGFFTSLDYVLRKTTAHPFNLLAAVIEPEAECRAVQLDQFDFIGYDLPDNDSGNSVLTNCDGFDKTFLPSDLNTYGLLSDYATARAIQEELPKNNPDHPHAATTIVALWRHRSIGR